MTTPYNQDEDPLTTRIILSAKTMMEEIQYQEECRSDSRGKAQTEARPTNIGTVTGIANSNKLVFTPKEGQQLRPNYTYTLKLNEKAEI